MPGFLDFLTLLLLRRSLSGHQSSVFHSARVSSFVFHGMRLYFVFPKSVRILLKMNCNVFYVCEVILCIDYWHCSKFMESYIFYIRKKFRSS